MHRSINAITIYAEKGTEISKNPGLLCLNPERVILVGAAIVHDGKQDNNLDDKLGSDWKIYRATIINVNFAGEETLVDSIRMTIYML